MTIREILMKSKSYYLLSLGCSKNTVDSESMSQLLDRSGYRALAQPDDASILIVNTCGFIGPAQAGIDPTCCNELAECKQARPNADRRRLPVARYGGRDWCKRSRRWTASSARGAGWTSSISSQRLRAQASTRAAVSPAGRGRQSSAWTSAARCAPRCRAPAPTSRSPMAAAARAPSAPSRASKARPSAARWNAILDEARGLSERGVRELILIAQDTTDYGHDLGMKDGLRDAARTQSATPRPELTGFG